jgi:hypothetical protein
MINFLSLLTYTHSNCSDLHTMYYDSLDNFFTNERHYTLTNKPINDYRFNQIIYDDNSNYYEQILLGLSKIETEYLLYSQEDYILYDYVDLNLLSECIEVLQNDKNVNFIRLISSGLSGKEQNYNNNFMILDNNSEYFFSTQITLWKKNSLMEMFKSSKVRYITDEPKNSLYLSNLGGIGLCTYLKSEKIGNHFNSKIYPYTATALVKGKWNFSEYGYVLENLLNKYNIDKHKRGII